MVAFFDEFLNPEREEEQCTKDDPYLGMQIDWTGHERGSRRGSPALIYGIHPVLEKLRTAPGDIIEVLLVGGRRGPALQRVEQAAREEHCRVAEIDTRALNALTHGARHQGVAARAAPFAYGSFEALLAASAPEAPDCVLFLDGVVDPRNLGGILRTSEAMGVGHVVIPRDRAAGVTAAVIKASSGAAHHVELYRIANLHRGLTALREKGYWLVGLDANAESRICDPVYPEKLAVVLGGEERGIRPLIRRGCDFLVSIPMHGRVESLNVGVAWGMFAYELARQRIAAVSKPAR